MQLYKIFFRAVLPFLLVLIATNAWSYTFNWGTLGWNPHGSLWQHFRNVDGSGVDVTVTMSGSTNRFNNSTPQVSNGRLKVEMDFAHRYESLSVRFTFSEPIMLVNSGVGDIDSGNFEDAVVVTASGGNILPVNVRPGSNIETVSLGHYQSRGGQTGDSDPAGLLEFSFGQKITEFTVVYKPGTNSPANPSHQLILFSGEFTFAEPPQPAPLSVTKTATPPGPVSSGDKIDYSITIKNDGGVTQTGIVVNDPLPAGTSYVAHSTLARGFTGTPSHATFADDFSTGNYSGNWGNHRFSDRWYEHDKNTHHTHTFDGHDGGNILVTSGQLKITAKNKDHGGDWIYRQLDLSGSTSAILTYHVNNQLDDDDTIVMEVYDGNSWHILRTYQKNGFSGNQHFDISAYISSHTRIRFRVTDEDDNGHLLIDNVLITADGSSVSAVTKDNIPGGTHPDLSSGVPPILVAAIDGFTLERGQTMTVTYSVLVGTTGRLKSIDNTASVTSVQHTSAATGSVSNPLRGHDFGDAPVIYGDASHEIKRRINLYLGASTDKPDAESGSQYSAAADGDDLGRRDDENGVVFTTDLVNRSVTATVTVNNGGGTALLCGWLDYDSSGGGAFEVTERHCKTIVANSGPTTETLTWGNLPTDRAYATFARFRITSDAAHANQPTGNAPDGEVEDYPVSYDFHVLDYGDAPASYGDPSHRIHQNLHIGAGDPDSESATQYSTAADGDDQDGNDDENGVLLSFNATGTLITAKVTVTNVTGAGAMLCGWLDGSDSGTPNDHFGDTEGECQVVGNNTINGVVTFSWGSGAIGGNVPAGDSYARFRLSTDTNMNVFDSTAANKGEGEVEDYFLSAKKDFGDAPLNYGIPSHGVPAAPALYLGSTASGPIPPDVESTHQPSFDAKGDDNNDTSSGGAGNDEDGFYVAHPATAIPTDRYGRVRIFNSTGNPSRICFWYDVTIDGVFDAPEGRCATVPAGGVLPISPDGIMCTTTGSLPNVTTCTLVANFWTAPTGASTFARARVASDLTMDVTMADGHFPDGEVEDVQDENQKVDLGDAQGYNLAGNSLLSQVFHSPYLGAVAPDSDLSNSPLQNPEANADDNQPSAGPDDEDGVSFRSPAGQNHTIFADVVVNNPTGGAVTVCGWLDVPSGGAVDGNFDPSDGRCQTTSAPNPTLIFQWAGLPTDKSYTTYARFVVSRDPALTESHTKPLFFDGETEDYRVIFNFTPTAVTIGKVELQALPAAAFLAGVGVEQMDDAALLALLEAWDPAAAASLAAADRDTILSALQQYLDPDGDGQVAVLAWDTLEERGTIGFYVDRREAEGTVDWVRINNDMLPGLITAPMGGEYQLADPAAQPGSVYQYQLIEQEARGSTRTYGPFTVEMP